MIDLEAEYNARCERLPEHQKQLIQTAISYAQLLAVYFIEAENLHGNDECAEACEKAGRITRSVIPPEILNVLEAPNIKHLM